MKDYYRIIGQADPLDDIEEQDGELSENPLQGEERKDEFNGGGRRSIEGGGDTEDAGEEDRETDETMTIVIYKYPTQVKGGPRVGKKVKGVVTENAAAGEDAGLLQEGTEDAVEEGGEEEGLDFGSFVEDKW